VHDCYRLTETVKGEEQVGRDGEEWMLVVSHQETTTKSAEKLCHRTGDRFSRERGQEADQSKFTTLIDEANILSECSGEETAALAPDRDLRNGARVFTRRVAKSRVQLW
jgi:hypothetical protein